MLAKTRLTIATTLAFPVFTQASITMVAWNAGGDSTTSTVPMQDDWVAEGPLDLDNDSVADDSRFGLVIGNRTPASPDYFGGTFHGAVSINTIDNVVAGSLAAANYGVHNAGTDHLVVHSQHSGNHHHTWDALFFWDKADFLNGGDSMPVSLDNDSVITVSFLNSSLNKGDEHLHYLIRDGSQWYISRKYYGPAIGPDRLGPLPTGGDASLDPSATDWAPYNPTGLNLHYATTAGSPHTFTDITAFGFFMDSEDFSQNSSRIEISGFTVIAIPEPSGVWLALGGLLPLLRRRRVETRS